MAERRDDADLASQLERLARLNAAGSLTDAEFTLGKARLLSGEVER